MRIIPTKDGGARNCRLVVSRDRATGKGFRLYWQALARWPEQEGRWDSHFIVQVLAEPSLQFATPDGAYTSERAARLAGYDLFGEHPTRLVG